MRTRFDWLMLAASTYGFYYLFGPVVALIYLALWLLVIWLGIQQRRKHDKHNPQ